MAQVVWEYTDGRNPPGRTIEGEASHMHAYLMRGYPIKIHTQEAYQAWCEAAGVDPVEPARPTKVRGPYEPIGKIVGVPEPEAPESYIERSGSYYSIFIHGEFKEKVRGKAKAETRRDELLAEAGGEGVVG